MKKILLSVGVAVSIAYSSYAGSATVTVAAGTMTNVFSLTPNVGSVWLKQAVVTPVAGDTAPQILTLIDTPTNQLNFVTAAYSNRVSYATNYIQVWTNFYGLVQSNNYVGGTLLTNYQLIDITNSVLAATNPYPIRAALACPTNAPVIYNPINVGFEQGIWVTNSAASGSATITVIW